MGEYDLRREFPIIIKRSMIVNCGYGWLSLLRNTLTLMQNRVLWQRSQRASALVYNRALKQALNLNPRNLLYLNRKFNNPETQTIFDIDNREFKPVPDCSKQLVILQIKQKFGILRIYGTNWDDFHRGVSTFAEQLSQKICEDCGAFKIDESHRLCTTCSEKTNELRK